MKISLRWLNEYLQPGNLTADEAEKALTFAGFPIESREPREGGDVCLDVEVTSNRGDVLSHVGVAREVAACTGRKLKLPAPGSVFSWFGEEKSPTTTASPAAEDAGSVVAIDNRVPEACPLFTARVIRGVKVGRSPKWLVAALEGIGQRSINNVVDITNFVAAEYGQPSHVFDLARLGCGRDGKTRIVIRAAAPGENLTLLDGKPIVLKGDEIVVAGEATAYSLAGVMGGLETGVKDLTTDVLLEAATWEPVAIRRASRRYGLRTEASYRFERIVDPRTIDAAGERLAALMARLAGGRVLPGVIHAGPEAKPLASVRLRPARCSAMLGVPVAAMAIQKMLEAHEIAVKTDLAGGAGGEPVLDCTIPAHRPDLEREIDLIEEVARTQGLEKLPVHEMVGVRVAGPQASEAAAARIGGVLTGLGFYEAVTFTFVSTKAAKGFLPAGLAMLRVCDERRIADPVLRPSAIPSLMGCRRANQDRGVRPDGDAGIRLYEVSSVFAEAPSDKKGDRGKAVENVNVALLADCCFPIGAKQMEQKQAGVRMLRGAIEAVVRSLGGEGVRIEIEPTEKTPSAAWDPGAFASVRVNGEFVGCMGLIAPSAAVGLEYPVVAAELNMASLTALWPPRSLVQALPAFPSIERDLSLIVREDVRWAKIDALVSGLGVRRLESWAFVGAYRGAQAGAGKKSVTLRMRFRDPSRTLTHEEISPQVETIVAAAKQELGAEVRTV